MLAFLFSYIFVMLLLLELQFLKMLFSLKFKRFLMLTFLFSHTFTMLFLDGIHRFAVFF